MELKNYTQKLKQTNSEEITFLVSKIPSSINIKIFTLISILLIMILIGVFSIRYPDSYKGSVTIIADNPSLNLVASYHGPIVILKKDHEIVKKGDVIAYIENESTFDELIELEKTILAFNSEMDYNHYYNTLPKIVHLGEINSSYFTFMNALQQYIFFAENKLYDKQHQLLSDLAQKQEKQLQLQQQRIHILNKNDKLAHNKVKRDSLLKQSLVISQEQYENTEQNYLNSRQYKNATQQDIYKLDQEILSTKSKGNEALILKTEKTEKLASDLYNSYNDLVNKIRSWRRTYLITAPVHGRVQYLSFLKNSQFINHQDPIFAVVPISSKMNGQMLMSDFGMGKIKENQDVLIRLNNFPHEEYGSIKGKVLKVSYVGNLVKTTNGEEKRYLIDLAISPSDNHITLTDGVMGEGEIMTNNKRLYERILERILLSVYR